MALEFVCLEPRKGLLRLTLRRSGWDLGTWMVDSKIVQRLLRFFRGFILELLVGGHRILRFIHTVKVAIGRPKLIPGLLDDFLIFVGSYCMFEMPCCRVVVA